MPQYDFVHHRRKEETILVKPRNLVLFEDHDILGETGEEPHRSETGFIDTPDDIRFIRRLKRDIGRKGKDDRFRDHPIPRGGSAGHFEFIEPTKQYADLIIPEGGSTKTRFRCSFPSYAGLRCNVAGRRSYRQFGF
jgi:uridine kinase